MATHNLLLLAGDGIGPEVMAEVKRLIDFFNKPQADRIRASTKGWSAAPAYDAAQGRRSPTRRWPKRKAADAVIFGAVGGPKWDNVPYDVRPEAGLLRLRKDLGLYANLRPAVTYPALADASSLKRELVEGLDIIILRELTGGVYFGEPKTITDLGNGQKRAIDTQVYDTYEIERIAPRRLRAGAQAPQQGDVDGKAQRHEDRACCGTRSSPALHAREFKDVQLEHQLADSGGMQLVRNPKQFDVIVTDNLFGDMLSDIAAMLTGSLGMLAVGVARRGRSEDPQAQGALRAGARFGARHRRQGHRQSDRHDRLIRHGAALLVRSRQAGRHDRQGDRGDAGEGHPHQRYRGARRKVRQHLGNGFGDPGRAGNARGLNGASRSIKNAARWAAFSVAIRFALEAEEGWFLPKPSSNGPGSGDWLLPNTVLLSTPSAR